MISRYWSELACSENINDLGVIGILLYNHHLQLKLLPYVIHFSHSHKTELSQPEDFPYRGIADDIVIVQYQILLVCSGHY